MFVVILCVQSMNYDYATKCLCNWFDNTCSINKILFSEINVVDRLTETIEMKYTRGDKLTRRAEYRLAENAAGLPGVEIVSASPPIYIA